MKETNQKLCINKCLLEIYKIKVLCKFIKKKKNAA